MSNLLVGTELTRVFNFKKSGKVISLEDIDPQMPPKEILKFYSGMYPELTSSTVSSPEMKGDKMIFTISSNLGTKG